MTSPTPRWIILSPHLDDAALSCGGLVAALPPEARVEIWTMFTRAPMRGPYSPLARWLHGVSGGVTGSRLARIRRREDRNACRVLGASHRHFPWVDAVYRRGADGRFCYAETRQDHWHADDDTLVGAIVSRLLEDVSASDILLAPLALGGHVDHVIAHHAAGRVGRCPVLYYSDVPYLESFPRELEWVSGGMWRSPARLNRAHVRTWIESVGCYKSQHEMLETEAGPLPALIEGIADGRGVLLHASDADSIARLAAYPVFGPPEPVPGDEDSPDRRHLLQSQRKSIDRPMHAAVTTNDNPRNLAPVAVFAFNRLDLLRSTLGALERSRGFAQSSVHVFSDAARSDHPGEVTEVEKLRAWLRKWCESRGATLHEAAENLGLRRSIVSNVSSVLTTHDNVIVIEDDLEVSRSFLTFMNQALHSYGDRADIVQVSGHNVPHREKLPAIGLLRVPASWGWATWRRAWRDYNDDASALLAGVRELDSHAFDMSGTYGYLEALERNAAGTLDTWAVRWYASVFLRGGLTVYPGQSLVRNIGFDTRGTNCGPSTTARAFSGQRINHRSISPDWHNVGTAETASFALALEAFYRWQQAQWTRPTWNERFRARLNILAGRPVGA